MQEKILNGRTVSVLKGFITLFLVLAVIILVIFLSLLMDPDYRVAEIISIFSIIILTFLGFAYSYFHKYYEIKKNIKKYKISEAKYIRFENLFRMVKVFVSYRNDFNEEKVGSFMLYNFYMLEHYQDCLIEIAYRDDSENILIVTFEEPQYDEYEKKAEEVKDKEDQEKNYDDFFDKEKYKL